MGVNHNAILFYGVYWDMDSSLSEDDDFEADMDSILNAMNKERGIVEPEWPDMRGLSGDAYTVAWKAHYDSPERTAYRQAVQGLRSELGVDFGFFGSCYSETGTYLYALGSATEASWSPSPVTFGHFDPKLADIKIGNFIDRYRLNQPAEVPGWFLAPLES